MSRSLNKKKHQRRINKTIRRINKNIYNDPAWLGRFIIRQIDRDWYIFDDKSGAIMTGYFEIVDKKTGKARLVSEEDGLFFDNHIFWKVNSFIVEDINTAAWSEEVEDFRNIDPPAAKSFSFWRNHWHQVVNLKEV